MMQTTLPNIYYIHNVGCKYCFNEWMADMFASSCMPSLSILVSYNKLVGYGNYADNSIYYLLYIKLCSCEICKSCFLPTEKSGLAKTGPARAVPTPMSL